MNITSRARHARTRRVHVIAATTAAALIATACAEEPPPKAVTAGALTDHDLSRLREWRNPQPVRAASTGQRRIVRAHVVTFRRGDPTSGQLRKLAWCESGRDHSAYGADGLHFGAYQFDLETWASVGGRGNPARASLAEQSHRAVLLFRQRGWQPWAASSACTGLR